MLTPYQGNHVTIGYYKCACKKEWKSAYSWSNTPQTCKECNLDVYPYKQHKPTNCKVKNKKEHIQHLCGKCKNKEHACNFTNV